MSEGGKMLADLIEAGIKDASFEGKITRLNFAGPDFPAPVRIIILPDNPKEMSKGEIEKQLRLLPLTQGFHYTSDDIRVVVTPESMDKYLVHKDQLPMEPE